MAVYENFSELYIYYLRANDSLVLESFFNSRWRYIRHSCNPFFIHSHAGRVRLSRSEMMIVDIYQVISNKCAPERRALGSHLKLGH